MSVAALPPVRVGPIAGRQPLYEWRGLLLDSARTCFPVAVITQVITLAARYGFNRVHWHLTDDQGWRFEVPEYPRLTTAAALLPRGRFDDYDSLQSDTRERAVAEQGEKWANGFYSDDDIATVLAHADAHGITIVPEVDLPGHMQAAIFAYPELGRPEGLALPEGSMRDDMWWPARNDLLWPTDAARDFIAAVMRRLTTLFPGSVVHIGGDECAYRQWASDPLIDEWMTRRGVSTVEGLQGWFMDEAASVLRERGRSVAVWDEACEIWDDKGTLVFAWDEARGMQRVNRAPQRFVFSDARTLYLNRVDPYAREQQKGMLPAISVQDIVTAPWAETLDERCLGVQACVWSEFVLDGDDLMSMLFPRLLAVAERLWAPVVDPAEVCARIAAEHEMLRAAGALDTYATTAR